MPTAGEDVKELELSYATDGNRKGCNRENSLDVSYTVKCTLTIQPSNPLLKRNKNFYSHKSLSTNVKITLYQLITPNWQQPQCSNAEWANCGPSIGQYATVYYSAVKRKNY